MRVDWRGLRADAVRFLLAIGPTLAAAALQLVVFALTARAVGPAAFGALAAVYAVSAIATDVAGLGGDLALVRAAATDRARFRRAWGHALTLMALSWPPVAVLAAAAALGLAPSLGAAAVALAAGEVAVWRAAAAAELAMVAHAAPVAASAVRFGVVGVRAALAVTVFGIAGAQDARVWAFAAAGQGLATAAVLIAGVGALYGRPAGGVDRSELGFGLLLMLNALARSLNGNIDRVVLAGVLPPATLGVWASGARLQMAGAIPTQAATRILHPRFFQAAKAGPAALVALTRAAAVRMTLVGLLGCAGMVAAAAALPLVLGAAYAGARPVAIGLAAAVPLMALQYPPADALTAAGRQGLRTAIYWGGALASAGLLALGAFAGGIAGAVAGFVAAQAGLAAALWLAWGARR
jgi:O-antigen/teichoic acid export membrane protein